MKTFGNIVCFRDLRQEVDDALALFGDKDAKGTVVLKPYAEYLAAYTEKVSQLLKQFPLARKSSENRRRRISSPYSARFCGCATSCRLSTISPMMMC